MGEPGREEREDKTALERYSELKKLAEENFPALVEEARIDRDPGDNPKNLRIFFSDDSFLDVWLSQEKYSFHWQSGENTVRWDNSPHHRDIETFPHHLHLKGEIKESQLEGHAREDFKHVIKFLKNKVL